MFSGEQIPGSPARHHSRTLLRLPLFPLSNVVLFPHALIPVHIFEPRYRKMANDVLAGNHLLAVSLLLEDESASGELPRVARVGGIGEVVLAQETPDGHLNLVVRGRARIAIDQEIPSEEPYRVVVAHEIPDEASREESEVQDADAALRALVTGLADAIPEGGELLKQVAAAQDTPAALADVLAGALVVEAPVRQSLLETTDVYERLERLSAEVVAMTARIGNSPRAN